MPTMSPMKAVLLDVPQSLLDERRRLGIDVFDECWEGVFHLAPPPSNDHQKIEGELQIALGVAAKEISLRCTPETGYYAGDDDYRVPDLVIAGDDARTERGVEGPAALVVEIRSPHDETDAKLGWYTAHGAAEILVIDPDTRAAELYVSRDHTPVLVQADADGVLRLGIGATVATVEGPDGPALRVVTAQGTTTV